MQIMLRFNISSAKLGLSHMGRLPDTTISFCLPPPLDHQQTPPPPLHMSSAPSVCFNTPTAMASAPQPQLLSMCHLPCRMWNTLEELDRGAAGAPEVHCVMHRAMQLLSF